MKVIDTFLFVDAYEADLLLLKLHLESPLVSHFVLVESDVTFRGDFKGLQGRKLVETDERFIPFRHLISFVEHHGRLHDGPPCYDTFYQNELKSRLSAWDYVNHVAQDEDWVIVSDVDEAVDCTDRKRAETFLNHLKTAGHDATLNFGHYRYWYDFDNRCYWKGIQTPVANVGTIRRDKASLGCRTTWVPHRVDVSADPYPLFFEYTFCFPQDAMWKKLTSFIHDGYTEEELRLALLTNHWVKAAARGEAPGRQSVDWLETVELTEQNSPKYVRDNLEKLKTNVIPADYREHRKRIYGV